MDEILGWIYALIGGAIGAAALAWVRRWRQKRRPEPDDDRHHPVS